MVYSRQVPDLSGRQPPTTYTTNRKHHVKHHNYHQHYQVKNARLHARAEAAFDFLVALAIGVGLAALLVAWWSS